MRLLEEYGFWFAGNAPPAGNRKHSVLDASTKFTYFKAMKQVLLCQFPHYPLLQSSENGWWHELIGLFSKLAFRTTMLDPAKPNDPSALPLYHYITTQDIGIGQCNFITFCVKNNLRQGQNDVPLFSTRRNIYFFSATKHSFQY